jgi:hypothetical protein
MVNATYHAMHLGVMKKIHELVLKNREVLHLQNSSKGRKQSFIASQSTLVESDLGLLARCSSSETECILGS